MPCQRVAERSFGSAGTAEINSPNSAVTKCAWLVLKARHRRFQLSFRCGFSPHLEAKIRDQEVQGIHRVHLVMSALRKFEEFSALSAIPYFIELNAINTLITSEICLSVRFNFSKGLVMDLEERLATRESGART